VILADVILAVDFVRILYSRAAVRLQINIAYPIINA